jgi:hypothetical protein
VIRDAYWKDTRGATRMHVAAAGDMPAIDLAYTIVPTHDTAGRVDGVVVYAEEISGPVPN